MPGTSYSPGATPGSAFYYFTALTKMTSAEAVTKLQMLSGDPEDSHREAEHILMEFLASNGFGVVSDAFGKARDSIGFWYV
jgi:hypothetical protein